MNHRVLDGDQAREENEENEETRVHRRRNPQQVGRIRKRGQDGTGFYDENITWGE